MIKSLEGWRCLLLVAILEVVICWPTWALPLPVGSTPLGSQDDAGSHAVLVHFEVLLLDGRTFEFASAKGGIVVIRDGVTRGLIGITPKEVSPSNGQAEFVIVYLQELDGTAVDYLGSVGSADDNFLYTERVLSNLSVGLGEARALSEPAVVELKLTRISMEGSPSAAQVGSEPNRYEPKDGSLFLIQDLCCVVCSDGIGGCGSSVGGSCGTCGS